MDCPYWKRAWIVQEIFLAKIIVFCYGEDVYSWQQFNGFISQQKIQEMYRDYALQHPSINGSPGGRVLQDRSVRQYSNSKMRRSQFDGSPGSLLWTFLKLVDDWASQECTDPRDKVFAFLGIIQHSDLPSRLPFKADYRKSLAEVCVELIELENRLSPGPSLKRLADWLRRIHLLEMCPSQSRIKRALKQTYPDLSLDAKIDTYKLHMPYEVGVLEKFWDGHYTHCTDCHVHWPELWKLQDFISRKSEPSWALDDHLINWEPRWVKARRAMRKLNEISV
jgi:hypothetical protein